MPVTVDQPTTKNLFLRVPASLHRAARIKCAEEQTPLNIVIIEFLEQWVKQPTETPRPSQRKAKQTA